MVYNVVPLLKKEYPNSNAIKTEIINLEAICHLPKSTEFFFSDIHGEYNGFRHLLKSGSGLIQNKIETMFETKDHTLLQELIYGRPLTLENFPSLMNYELQEEVLVQLLILCKEFSNNYTRSKVRKMLPKEFSYILEELLHVEDFKNRNNYYLSIIKSVINNGLGFSFIRCLRDLIPKLVVDQLHIIGDIYDRGPRPDKVIDILMKYREVDIQWGNHDISWLGAMAGNTALIANVIRLALRYNTFDLLEYGYGINLRALCLFAKETYGNDDCSAFIPATFDQNKYDDVDLRITAMMHKAITIIQLKLEGQLLKKHPEYNLHHRNMLLHIDYQYHTISIENTLYPLNTHFFPTIDPTNPLLLTKEEQSLVDGFHYSFVKSERLKKHMDYVYNNGSIYKTINDNLLYHGCIPFNEDGTLAKVTIFNQKLSGKELLDAMNDTVSMAYKHGHVDSIDFMWYLWCGPASPLFGKDKLAYFENYFIDTSSIKKEKLNPYYTFIDNSKFVATIFSIFLLPSSGHIINGHVPIIESLGQNPIKANKRVFMIDGGICKSYQQKTGIAGYTLIYDHSSIILATHHIHSNDITITNIEQGKMLKVLDSDKGKEIRNMISILQQLLKTYIKQNI